MSRSKKAQWIQVDGTVTDVRPANGKDFSLYEMQKFVGGYVELIKLRYDRELYVNEDGNLRQLPINVEATYIYGAGTPIRGNVLVCDKGMVK